MSYYCFKRSDERRHSAISRLEANIKEYKAKPEWVDWAEKLIKAEATLVNTKANMGKGSSKYSKD